MARYLLWTKTFRHFTWVKIVAILPLSIKMCWSAVMVCTLVRRDGLARLVKFLNVDLLSGFMTKTHSPKLTLSVQAMENALRQVVCAKRTGWVTVVRFIRRKTAKGHWYTILLNLIVSVISRQLVGTSVKWCFVTMTVLDMVLAKMMGSANVIKDIRVRIAVYWKLTSIGYDCLSVYWIF